MKSLSLRFTTALLTFLIGVGVTTAWMFNPSWDVISPISIIADTTPSSATLEMVFVLDTTGSMGGLIEGAKQRIWGIVNEVMQNPSRPAVRVGLVAYRDRGDQYVTQVLPLTEDLDLVYTTLMEYEADGGGDEREDVRRALADGVRRAGWSQSAPYLAQIIFLVGDAPPHDDYDDEEDTITTATSAVQMGMTINTIQCGNSASTASVWRAIAHRGQGQYFAIAHDGGVQAINTPYDEELGRLATTLGGTYVAYGFGGRADAEQRRVATRSAIARVETRVALSAPSAAKAERALNKAMNSVAYIGDLLQNIENGSVKLESVSDDDLPADLRRLSVDQRKQEVEKRLAERRELRAKIVSLSRMRDEFVSAERKKMNGAKQSSFDTAVAAALKEQLARKGI